MQSSELGCYVSYGVRAYLVLGERKRLVAQLTDMSPNRLKMTRLVSLLNEKGTSPFLMLRVAEDILDL